MEAEQVAELRRFNRLFTVRIGALQEHYLGRDRSLGESRVLYEIGPAGVELRELRSRLGLDSGYLSRLMRSLAGRGLVRVRPVPEDRRVRRAELTRAGLAEYRTMDRLSDEGVQTLLTPLSERQRTRLVAALADARRLLRLAGVRVERTDPAGATARWCLAQYFAELSRRFEGGFDPGATLPVADEGMVPPRGSFLVASIDGEPVACGALKPLTVDAGYLKRMWVSGAERGLGLGRRMLEALEAEARALGYRRVCLETNRALTEAIALYRSSGYGEVPAFNDEPYAHHWFEKAVV